MVDIGDNSEKYVRTEMSKIVSAHKSHVSSHFCEQKWYRVVNSDILQASLNVSEISYYGNRDID